MNNGGKREKTNDASIQFVHGRNSFKSSIGYIYNYNYNYYFKM